MWVYGRMLFRAEALRGASVWDPSGPPIVQKPGALGDGLEGRAVGGSERRSGSCCNGPGFIAGRIWTWFQHPDIHHHTVKLETSAVTGRSLVTNVYNISSFTP